MESDDWFDFNQAQDFNMDPNFYFNENTIFEQETDNDPIFEKNCQLAQNDNLSSPSSDIGHFQNDISNLSQGLQKNSEPQKTSLNPKPIKQHAFMPSPNNNYTKNSQSFGGVKNLPHFDKYTTTDNSNPSFLQSVDQFKTRTENRELKLLRYKLKRARRNYSRIYEFKNNENKKQPREKSPAETKDKLRQEQLKYLSNSLKLNQDELEKLRENLENQQIKFATLCDQQQNHNQSFSSQIEGVEYREQSEIYPNFGSTETIKTEDSGSLCSTSSLHTLDDNNLNFVSVEKRRQEKLKKLGGPPSDVYYPWWNGINLNHPAFHKKEDWPNLNTQKDPDILAQERLNYLITQHTWKQEQLSIADKYHNNQQQQQQQQSIIKHSIPQQPIPHTTTTLGYLAHQTTPILHNSPRLQIYSYPLINTHQNSPIKPSQGYWAGNYAPMTEKIDFSKISLRKIETPPSQQYPYHTETQPHLKS